MDFPQERISERTGEKNVEVRVSMEKNVAILRERISERIEQQTGDLPSRQVANGILDGITDFSQEHM